MRGSAHRRFSVGAVLGLAVLVPAVVLATVSFNHDVTPDFFVGDGIANGDFTVDRASGVEIGLRGKLRFNASCLPEDTFNSNGDGTYSFAAVDRGSCWGETDTPE